MSWGPERAPGCGSKRDRVLIRELATLLPEKDYIGIQKAARIDPNDGGIPGGCSRSIGAKAGTEWDQERGRLVIHERLQWDRKGAEWDPIRDRIGFERGARLGSKGIHTTMGRKGNQMGSEREPKGSRKGNRIEVERGRI